MNKCSLKQGMNPFEVNLRAVYGMRTIGADHASLEKLCGFFNMPKPMTVKNFTNISNSLHHAAKVVAQRSMSTAMNELRSVRNIYKTDSLDIGVSVDGTWQRRGFTSLNGVRHQNQSMLTSFARSGIIALFESKFTFFIFHVLSFNYVQSNEFVAFIFISIL